MNISMDFLFSGAKPTEVEQGKKGADSASTGNPGGFLKIVGRELGFSGGGKGGYVLKDSLSAVDQKGQQQLEIVSEQTLSLPKEKSGSGVSLDFRDALAVMRNMLRNADGTEVSEEDIARFLANEGISLSDIALFVSQAETDKLAAELAGSMSEQGELSVAESEGEADDNAAGASGANKLQLCVSSLLNALRRFVGAESGDNSVSSAGAGQNNESVTNASTSDDVAGVQGQGSRVQGQASGALAGNEHKQLPGRMGVAKAGNMDSDPKGEASNVATAANKTPPLHEVDRESGSGSTLAQSNRVAQVQEPAHAKGGQFSDQVSVNGQGGELSKSANTVNSGADTVQKEDQPVSRDTVVYRDTTSDKVVLEGANIPRDVNTAGLEARVPKETGTVQENQTAQFAARGRVVTESEPEAVGAPARGESASIARDFGPDVKELAGEMERAANNLRQESASAGQNEVKIRGEGSEQVVREPVAAPEPVVRQTGTVRQDGNVENLKDEPVVEANINADRNNFGKEPANTIFSGRRYESGRTIQNDVMQEDRIGSTQSTESRIGKSVDTSESIKAPQSNPEMNSVIDGSGLNQRVVRRPAGEPAGQEEAVLSNVVTKPVSGNTVSLSADDGVQSGMDAAVARGQGAEFAGAADTGVRAQGRAASDGTALSESGGQQAEAGSEVFSGAGTDTDMNRGAGGRGGDTDGGTRGFGRSDRRGARSAAGKDEKDLSATAFSRSSQSGPVETGAKAAGTSFVNVMDRVERFSELANRLDKYLLELVGGDDKSMIIRLVPANLGKIELQCSDDNGVLQVQAVVENSHVRDLLQQQESLLKDLIQNSGYKLAQFDVRTNDDQSDARRRQSEGKNSDMLGQLTDESSRSGSIPAANTSSTGHVPGRDKLWYVA